MPKADRGAEEFEPEPVRSTHGENATRTLGPAVPRHAAPPAPNQLPRSRGARDPPLFGHRVGAVVGAG